MNATNITFIGLGTMGYHMAGHLSTNKDVNLRVYNRTQSKAYKWNENFTGKACATLQDAVIDADIIITCAGKDEDLEEILFSKNGIYQHIKPNTVFIDHTTTSYNLAKTIASQLNEKHIAFIDAPVSGGEAGAINGALSIMAGGDEKTINKHRVIMGYYAKNITYIGATGYGQLAKMVNQICIAGVLQGLSEAINFAKNENIDIDTLISAISGGAAQSWQMDNRAITMAQDKFDFGFAIKWMIKDLGYCLDRAKDNNTELELTQNVYNKYSQLANAGKDNYDTSALILHNK